MSDFKSLLVANRGEIAVRIMQTAKRMGYRTVAVYSDADADALHVRTADEAVRIGTGPVTDSYLNPDAILAAARITGAEAVHPGYGFLSENSAFSQACLDQGLCFIGPPPAAIALMGDKRQAKQAVAKVGVPTVPGYAGSAQDLARLTAEAQRIGTPLMIKASAGGGGRGMRLVTDLNQLEDQLGSARTEARNAFGSDELILERAVNSPRHIEVQVLADHHGHSIHLGERDCSLQRRHQKVVEEAPSPFVTDALREAMGAAAIQVAALCQYQGVGTVEFLVDPEGQYYFLQMNTRLQVEHPVTEMITGLDLVEWQLRVAAGEPLPFTQEQIRFQGHAMEARLYAEDPYDHYLPQTGPVWVWRTEQSPGTRVDTGSVTGSDISAYYDPMLAKVIAHGPDRATALRKLDRALDQTIVLGTLTNKRFLRQLLQHKDFKAGMATTATIEEQRHHWLPLDAETLREHACLAAAWLCYRRRGSAATRLTGHSHLTLATSGQQLNLQVTEDGNGWWQTQLDSHSRRYRFQGTAPPYIMETTPSTETDDAAAWIRRTPLWIHHEDDAIWLDQGPGVSVLRDLTHQPPSPHAASGDGAILAPMDGNLLEIRVQPGDSVTTGQVVAVVEAMKMEHQLKATVSGRVTELTAIPGQQVKARALLLSIEPQAETGDDSGS